VIKSPVHPGTILREDVLKPLGLSIAAAASRLGTSRVVLSRIVNGRSRISASFAMRLEKAGAGSAQTWVHLQASYDLATTKLPSGDTVRPLWRKAPCPPA
jgi:addiction module HigA family antidote